MAARGVRRALVAAAALWLVGASNASEGANDSDDANVTENASASEDTNGTENASVSEESNVTENASNSEDANATENASVSEGDNVTEQANASEVSNSSKLPPLSIKVDVQGQSGKFKVYDEKKGANSGIQVTMDALRELDAGGSAIGTSGSVKHSINTFAAQDFVIEEPKDVDLGGVMATAISFSSNVSSIGQIRVDTYIISEDGEVGPPSEKWAVKRGDLKWNIAFDSWEWCGCEAGKDKQEGAFIDVDVTVKELSGGGAKGNGTSVGLGGGLTLELSKKVLVDGQWQDMPEGYPKITTSGSDSTLTFRFPRFNGTAVYDPVVTGFASEPEVAGSGGAGGADNSSADAANGTAGNESGATDSGAGSGGAGGENNSSADAANGTAGDESGATDSGAGSGGAGGASNGTANTTNGTDSGAGSDGAGGADNATANATNGTAGNADGSPHSGVGSGGAAGDSNGTDNSTDAATNGTVGNTTNPGATKEVTSGAARQASLTLCFASLGAVLSRQS